MGMEMLGGLQTQLELTATELAEWVTELELQECTNKLKMTPTQANIVGGLDLHWCLLTGQAQPDPDPLNKPVPD